MDQQISLFGGFSQLSTQIWMASSS